MRLRTVPTYALDWATIVSHFPWISHFHDTHTSYPITRSEEHKRARLNVEEGVRLALKVRRKAKEEEEHARLEAEEEACLIEETRLKAKEEDQACLRADKEAHLSE